MSFTYNLFLKEAAPFLKIDPAAHRRKNIRRRIDEFIVERGYRSREDLLRSLVKDANVADDLRSRLTVTISRFFRDRPVFEKLAGLLPDLLSDRLGEEKLIWSAGCCGGEEAYSLAMIIDGLFPGVAWSGAPVQATDISEEILSRAREGKYCPSSIKEVPGPIEKLFFQRETDSISVKKSIRQMVSFSRQDLLKNEAPKDVVLILCRNMAFTYFDGKSRNEVIQIFCGSLGGKGCLVIGKKERLPAAADSYFDVLDAELGIFEKT